MEPEINELNLISKSDGSGLSIYVPPGKYNGCLGVSTYCNPCNHSEFFVMIYR